MRMIKAVVPFGYADSTASCLQRGLQWPFKRAQAQNPRGHTITIAGAHSYLSYEGGALQKVLNERVHKRDKATGLLSGFV